MGVKILLFLWVPLTLWANRNIYPENIKVRIYSAYHFRIFEMRIIDGTYQITDGQHKPIRNIGKDDRCRIEIKNNSLSLNINDRDYDDFKQLHFKAIDNNSAFRVIHAINAPSRNYDDNLFISIFRNGIRLINTVDIDKYVAGVVQAEGGIMNNNEFFKMQAVASRTYVLRNFQRHMRYGFNVCDTEHCQVFHGTASKSDIVQMTEKTKTFVIIDSSLNFITAPFHANCGGHTVNSEDVWSVPASYMKGVLDTFCFGGRHAFWEFKISREKFLNYLSENFNFPVNDSLLVEKALSFNQDDGRKIFFVDLTDIHLKKIRSDLNLKSTFFSIFAYDDMLIFRGRGFGHGVGICQEGAMQMINHGFTYDEVIKYYFRDVYVVSYKDLMKLLP